MLWLKKIGGAGVGSVGGEERVTRERWRLLGGRGDYVSKVELARMMVMSGRR